MQILLLMLAVVFPGGLNPQETVPMEQGVEYVGAQIPAQVAAGKDAQLEVYFKVDEPLAEGVSHFVHIESTTSDCRVVRDGQLSAHGDGALVRKVDFRVPASKSCSPQQMDVYTGLYEVDGGRRYEVRGLATPDHRIPAGSFELVAPGAEADTSMQSWTGAEIEGRRVIQQLRPWWGWAAGLALALALLAVLRTVLAGRDRDEDEDAEQAADTTIEKGRCQTIEAGRWWNIAPAVAIAAVAITSIVVAVVFVNDDAFISFR